MSDLEAPVAPEAAVPAETTEVAVPETETAPSAIETGGTTVTSPEDGTAAPLRTKRQIREGVARRAKERALPGRIEKGVPEGGQFTAEEGETPAAAEEAVAVPDSEAAPVVAEAVSEEPVEEVNTPTTVSIPLSQNHPLAAQGKTELVVPVELERDIRTLLNSTARSQELNRQTAALTAAQEEIARLKARQAYVQEKGPEDPELQKLMAEVAEAYPEQVEKLQAGLKAIEREGLQTAESTALADVHLQTTAHNFMASVDSMAEAKYPVWATSGELRTRMDNAFAQYGDFVDARNTNLQRQGQQLVGPSEQEFFGWVDTHYVTDPRVQESLQQFQTQQNEASRAQIASEERRKFAEQEAAKLREAGDRHSVRPPAAAAKVTQSKTVPPPPPTAKTGDRARSIRRDIGQRLRERGM